MAATIGKSTKNWNSHFSAVLLVGIVATCLGARSLRGQSAADLSLPEAPVPESSPTNVSTGVANTLKGHIAASSSFPIFKEREKHYLSDTFGVSGLVGALPPSIIDQVHELKVSYPRDGFVGFGAHPDHGSVLEWGEGLNGFSKRYASRYGQHLIGTTARYGLGEVLHEDVSYHRCECAGVLSRATHAIASSVIAYTASGRAVPSVPALLSPFIASEIAVKAWYPARFDSSDALRIGVPDLLCRWMS